MNTVKALIFIALAFMASEAHATAMFTGTWGAGGHWVGSPITYEFVNSPVPPGANPHPAKDWTNAEKGVIAEAFSEWDKVLCNICFEESSSGNITLRWEDADFFQGDRADLVAFAYVNGIGDLGFGPDYPQGEIYFNTTASWYVDADPSTDEAIAAGMWDLLSVAKHEIGHMLGLEHQEQAFFDAHPELMPGVMDDRSVADGGWASGERRHDNTADWYALEQLGYAVHLPEPSAMVVFATGVAFLFFGYRRKTVRSG